MTTADDFRSGHLRKRGRPEFEIFLPMRLEDGTDREIVLAREPQVLAYVAPWIYNDGKAFSTTQHV
jgi:hypothetical protein